MIDRFGTFDGAIVERATLANARGMRARVFSWGATLQSLEAADGTPLVLGFERFEDYPAKSPFFGSTVGQFANRIEGGAFTLGEKRFDLPKNEGGVTCLHGGGPVGWGKTNWTLLRDETDDKRVVFQRFSPDGEAGFPGNVRARCLYELTDDDVLRIEMRAETDRDTVINMAHHSYWSLDGVDADVAADRIAIEADAYLPVDERNIPSGAIAPVAETRFDFRQMQRVDQAGDPDYDHCFVLRGAGFRRAATLIGAASGRKMELWSDQPGVQLYTGFKLGPVSAEGRAFRQRSGLCLETQAFPDAPNRADFPSAVLRPGDVYLHRMEHRFFS